MRAVRTSIILTVNSPYDEYTSPKNKNTQKQPPYRTEQNSIVHEIFWLLFAQTKERKQQQQNTCLQTTPIDCR
jgi:hypothetical protein